MIRSREVWTRWFKASALADWNRTLCCWVGPPGKWEKMKLPIRNIKHSLVCDQNFVYFHFSRKHDVIDIFHFACLLLFWHIILRQTAGRRSERNGVGGGEGDHRFPEQCEIERTLGRVLDCAGRGPLFADHLSVAPKQSVASLQNSHCCGCATPREQHKAEATAPKLCVPVAHRRRNSGCFWMNEGVNF